MKTFQTRIPKGKQQNRVDKFGLNATPVAGNFLWEPGHAPVVDPDTTALWISSTHAGDTAIDVLVEYIDANGLPQTVTATTHAVDSTGFVAVLDGSTPTLSCAFVNRAHVDDDSVTLNGDLYLSKDNTDAGGDGIPDTLTDVKAHIPQAHNQTMQGKYLVPAGFELHVEGWQASIAKATGVAGGLEITLKFKTSTGSWRTVHGGGIYSSGNTVIDKKFPATKDFPAGTMVGLKFESATTTGLVTYGEIDCYLETL